ncbi:MFS transporter [Corticibacter populi]|uniref:MFS transporter n=1 Tax=Corticibacter populi TaxID=1550736 RepID=A0A3M6QV34_9BURK|nr:MFS transporter [Corticibacter populi]RMX06875.1 MFS transporter [Corticibacter populi]RZS31531.1 DHA1 family inner membrane transport protein [Corticibacter populi]
MSSETLELQKAGGTPLAIWALALGTFGIGVTEFVIAGLLPLAAQEFGISVPAAGNLATSYALGVFVGAPAVVMLGNRLPRKTLMVLMMVVFILGNLLTAAAPGFAWALAGRVLTSMAHGAFIGVGAIIASSLVPPQRRASAIALMFTGMTLANLAGIPAGTWLGHAVSWRATFYAVAAIGVLTLIALVAWLPRDTVRRDPPRLGPELSAFLDPGVLLAMAITVLGPAAFFTSLTYIAPMMREVAGFGENGVTFILFLFGLGLFIGNLVGGRFADRALMPVLYVTLGGQALVLLAFWLLVDSRVASSVCVFLMAAFGFASVSPIQKLVMDKASAAGAPNLASSVNIGMFNLGNAIGAALGGLVIAHGFGLAAPNAVAALLSMAALAVALWLGRTSQRPADTRLSHKPAEGQGDMRCN